MMKKNIYFHIIATILFLTGVSCSDFLDEESIAKQTANSYFVTEEGFEDLTRSIYPVLRDIIQQRTLVMRGTDLFSQGGWDNADANGPSEDTYNSGLGATFSQVQDLWDVLYLEIGRTNSVVTRAANVQGMDEGKKAQRVAEAKVLRSLCFFYLVQQFGDIPMPLEETSEVSKEVIRVPASEVYSQIISDLTDAERVLPTQGQTNWGRVTQGTAQFLLARVYLTRGWDFEGSLGGSDADFDQALSFADKVIKDYPLADQYSDLFPQRSENPLLETNNPSTQNAENDEIVFAVQYSTDVLNNSGDPAAVSPQEGNDFHSIFGNSPDDLPGAPTGRTADYNRYQSDFHVTPAVYRLYDPALDNRYDHNFVEKVYAIIDAPGFVPADGVAPIDIKSGDVVLELRPWNDPATTAEERGLDVGGTLPYAVLNTDEFGVNEKTNYHGAGRAMMMWKFWEPNIEYGDAGGTFDYALFRSAEAYLIAAEAILKGASGGSLGSAEVYYNAVVDRALGDDAGSNPMRAAEPADVSSFESVSYRATAGNLDIDMILNERARELLAEYVRWYDLKRTEKLIERAIKYNPWTAAAGNLESRHLLRPIPIGEIDLASNPLDQNPGY